MSKCCRPETKDADKQTRAMRVCPRCHNSGKSVHQITLKSLLFPKALEMLNANLSYCFCEQSQCPVVYFSEMGQTFTTTDLKIPVFQKDLGEDIPICYCFGWTRQRIQMTLKQQDKQSILASIAHHIKAGRCGCDVNNPQGSCCLKNVKSFLVLQSD